MSYFQDEQLEDLNITYEELDKIKEALKKKEFRDLLSEYVEEVNDPENRKLYEQEITQLEHERGYEIKFIHPTPGYCIKTSSDGSTKTYVNICSNEFIEKPTSKKSNQDGNIGLNWSIPYLLTSLRKDYDSKRKIYHLYDVIFHPDTLHLAKKNDSFLNVVNTTAIEGIQNNFKVVLDAVNLKVVSSKYKGNSRPSVIRKKLNKAEKINDLDSVINVQYGLQMLKQPSSSPSQKNIQTVKNDVSCNLEYITPKFDIKHRSCVDLQNFTNDSICKINAATPTELVVSISLPLIKSASDADLNVDEKKLSVVCEKPAKYKLEIDLPYSVCEKSGNAVFDKSTKVLTVTLPVKQIEENLNKAIEFLREDSGVESDRGSGNSSVEDESLLLHSDEKITVLEDETPIKSEPIKSEIICDIQPSESCDSKVHYSFPNFTSNYSKSTIAFTLHIKNIDRESISYKILKENTAIQFCLCTVGAGYFPMHYSFFLDFVLPFQTDSVKIEVWDNSVIIQVSLPSSSCTKITHYYVGLNENDSNLKKLEFPHPVNLSKSCSEKQAGVESQNGPTVSVLHHDSNEVSLELTECNNAIPLGRNDVDSTAGVDSDDEHEGENETKKENKQKSNEKSIKSRKSTRRKKFRLHSTSSIENIAGETSDLPSSIDSYNFMKSTSSNHKKGILKYSRSLSESEANDYSLYDDNYSCSLHDCTDVCSHTENHQKKTVRFSDVISSKTFRSNVSILSQKKRTQKKQKFKKRLQERRASESETECEAESKSSCESKQQSKKSNQKNLKKSDKIVDNNNHELDDSISYSETSGDTSDGSESNENYVESGNIQKDSKSRQHKNWRKTAGAKSKLQLLNDLMFQLDDV